MTCENPHCVLFKDNVQGAGYCSGSCAVVTNVLERTGNLRQFAYSPKEVAIKLMDATHPGFLDSLTKASVSATELDARLTAALEQIGRKP